MENILLLGFSGVYLTDSQELSSPEGPSNVGHKPIEKARWPLRNRSEASRGPAYKRGPDKEQQHPEEQKTNHIPTQTVVILEMHSSHS